MAGLPDAVVDRAQEIADALSGKADLEEQVPLKRRLAKVAPAAQTLILDTRALIHVLDPQTIGQIAAGEVVERPLSVVKELVENAVDAGATRVSVSLEDGGVRSSRSSTTGRALRPRRSAACRSSSCHEQTCPIATIWNRSIRWDFAVKALASIAAVAHVEIVSREPHAADWRAHRCTCRAVAGPRRRRPLRSERSFAPVDLFANVPVRREYLRSPSAEFNRISDWLSTFALAYPGITFSLHHDGKEVWVMPATATCARVLRHGVRQRRRGYADRRSIRRRRADCKVRSRGYISAPGNDRPDRRMQLLFVNGRLLRSTLLAGAWTAGYSTFAMIGRQPYGVLFLTLPPEHVDPNVHPTKSDVRLRFGHQVFDAVKRAIAATLRDHATARFRDAVTVSAGTAIDGREPGNTAVAVRTMRRRKIARWR